MCVTTEEKDIENAYNSEAWRIPSDAEDEIHEDTNGVQYEIYKVSIANHNIDVYCK